MYITQIVCSCVCVSDPVKWTGPEPARKSYFQGPLYRGLFLAPHNLVQLFSPFLVSADKIGSNILFNNRFFDRKVDRPGDVNKVCHRAIVRHVGIKCN